MEVRAIDRHGPYSSAPTDISELQSAYAASASAAVSSILSGELSLTTTDRAQPTTFSTSISFGSSSIATITGSTATPSSTSDTGPLTTAYTDSQTSPDYSTSIQPVASTSSPVTSATAASSSTSAGSSSSSTSLADGSAPVVHRSHAMSTAAIAAVAVIVPLVVIGLLLLFGFFVLRRRRQRRRSSTRRQPCTRRPPPAPAPEMAEKVAEVPPTSPGSGAPTMQAREAANSGNATYFTGLDTESQHESTLRQSEEAPPAYSSWAQHTTAAVHAAGAGSESDASTIHRPQPAHGLTPLPRISEPERSPFADPPASRPEVSRQSSAKPNVSRNASNRSITSTLYSDTASVHEARPARRSIGGAQMVRTSSGMEYSPFADPEE